MGVRRGPGAPDEDITAGLARSAGEWSSLDWIMPPRGIQGKREI